MLEWNKGNHFQDVDVRCGKGFLWCMGENIVRSTIAKQIGTEQGIIIKIDIGNKHSLKTGLEIVRMGMQEKLQELRKDLKPHT